MPRITLLLSQIKATRAYTLAVLDHAPEPLWFTAPPGAVTHIAWHVGHLVCAQYAHFIQRIFGETPADAALYPRDIFDPLFSKGSTPVADPALYPPLPELRRCFTTLHDHCVTRFSELRDAALDDPILAPHGYAKTRADMAMYWIRHEALHTGQIALIRRSLGLSPWR